MEGEEVTINTAEETVVEDTTPETVPEEVVAEVEGEQGEPAEENAPSDPDALQVGV